LWGRYAPRVDFDWDVGNRDKNLRHGVHDWEIEEAFEDPRQQRIGRSQAVNGEARFINLGRSRTSGKYLKIVYTVRIRVGRRFIRPISAVEMTPSERRTYLR
jgi:uncharacterized DUF497 family protein